MEFLEKLNDKFRMLEQKHVLNSFILFAILSGDITIKCMHALINIKIVDYLIVNYLIHNLKDDNQTEIKYFIVVFDCKNEFKTKIYKI